jgi:group I intron endonuclease
MFSQGYVGISKNLTRRFHHHAKRTQNAHLKNAINKYGWDNLIKQQILIADEKYCLDIEQKLRPANNMGWNIVMGGGKPPVTTRSGYKQLAHVTEAVRKYWTGRKQTLEHRNKISKSLIGRIVTEETRKKISVGNKNRPLIKCYHCDKKGDIGSMTRWHMNNCKFKEQQ